MDRGTSFARCGMAVWWVCAAVVPTVASCGPWERSFDVSSPQEVRILDLAGGAELALVWIPPGGDVLGSPADQEWQLFDEGPQRTVRFEEGFWIGRYEVTQAQWEAVMGANPSRFAGNPDRPVEQVSWLDCQAFVEKLNALLGTEGFALPDEEEWEYACRAGTDTPYYFGEDREDLGAHAWFIRNSGQQTHPVGEKLANPWGLYDMYGNVAEWCTNALAPPSDATRAGIPAKFDLPRYRITRGGSWFSSDRMDCRSAARSAELLDERSDRVGLRVVFRGRTLPEGEGSPRAS